MATGTTIKYALPYPVSTDPVRISDDIEQLANKIDNILQETIEDASASMWTGGTFSNGISTPTYNDTSGKMSMTLAQDIRNTASPQFAGILITGQSSFQGAISSEEDINLSSGKQYLIDDQSVLSLTELGPSVINSSLTSVGTIISGTWSATAIAANKGGTGITSFSVGDILYASSSSELSKLAAAESGNALISNGSSSAPSWGKVELQTHVSGTLPISNGGTGTSSFTGTGSIVFSESPTITGTITAGTINSTSSSLTLLSSTTSQPSLNASIVVERGEENNVSILWNEIANSWQYTNDGSTFLPLGGQEVVIPEPEPDFPNMFLLMRM